MSRVKMQVPTFKGQTRLERITQELGRKPTIKEFLDRIPKELKKSIQDAAKVVEFKQQEEDKKTVVYTMTGKKYKNNNNLEFVDYGDPHLVRFLIRDSGITENVRVLYFKDKILKKEKRYPTTIGKKYIKDIWNDWITADATGSDRITQFESDLNIHDLVAKQAIRNNDHSIKFIDAATSAGIRLDSVSILKKILKLSKKKQKNKKLIRTLIFEETVKLELLIIQTDFVVNNTHDLFNEFKKSSRSQFWSKLKNLTFPNKPTIKYQASNKMKIFLELKKIDIEQKVLKEQAKFDKQVKNIKIVIQPASKLTAKQIEQRFLDSKTLKHCVFQPVINWANNKIIELKKMEELFKKPKTSTIKKYNSFVKIANNYMELYKDGAPSEIIKKFCNRINVNFIIDDILTIDHKGANFITIKCDKKAIKTFKFINSRLNHIELNNLTLRDGGEQIILPQVELNKKYIDLKKNNIDLTYNKINNNIQWISTINESYQLDTETKSIFKEFYNYLDDKYQIKHNQSLIWKDEIYSNLVQSSVHQCGRFLFKDNELEFDNFSRLDMRAAYKEFDKCDYYQGIPVQFSEYTYVKFTFPQGENASQDENKLLFLKEHIGIYRISNVKYNNCSENTKRILDEMSIYNGIYDKTKNTNYIDLTSPELIFMIDNNIDFDIEYGCWTTKTSDWKFPDWMNKREVIQEKQADGSIIKKVGPKWYSKIIGYWTAVRETTDIYIDGCEKWANHIKSLGYNVEFNPNIIKDRDIAKELDIAFSKGKSSEEDIENFLELNNEGSIKIQFDRKKSSITHRCHFASFATSYQRIRLLQQLFKINYNDIYGVMTDEIIYNKNALKKEDIMYGFIEKSKKYPNIVSCGSFLSQCNVEVNEPHKDAILTMNITKSDNQNIVTYNKYAMLTYKYISNGIENVNTDRMDITFPNNSNFHQNVHKGPGGSCKSFWNLSYTGYIRPIYTCPSHKLRDNKQKEFPNMQTEVIYNMINFPKEDIYINGSIIQKIRPPCNIINDEATCNTQYEFEKLEKNFPFATKHMLGDFDDKVSSFQLMSIADTPFTYSNYSWTIINYTTNKRAKCEKLKSLLKWYRTFMRDNFNEFDVSKNGYREWSSTAIEKLFKNIKTEIKTISEKEAIAEYSINDYILVGTRNIKAKKGNRAKYWTDKMNEANKGDKYLMVKNNGTEKKKDRFNGSILIPSENENCSNAYFKKRKCFEPRHAFTCHQIQGETIKSPNKIFIDLNNFFDVFRMLYVALSRAEYINQLRIVI